MLMIQNNFCKDREKKYKYQTFEQAFLHNGQAFLRKGMPLSIRIQ